MTPLLGLTAVFCLCIIVVRNIYIFFERVLRISIPRSITGFYSKQRKLLSVFIIGSVSSLIVVSGVYMFYLAATKPHSNVAYVSTLFMEDSCTPFFLPAADQKIAILRLDDVQAFSWSDIAKQMMDDAFTHKYPVVAGVIPYRIREDISIVRYLKSHSCHVELAMHGYTHAGSDYEPNEGEFAFVDSVEARRRFEEGIKELQKITTQNLISFIPPRNVMSDEAKAELLPYGFRILSMIGTSIYDVDASTWDFTDQKPYRAEETFTACEEHWNSGDSTCVIMLHPQDYAKEDGTIDADRYSQYTSLLKLLSENNIGVLTFKQYEESPWAKSDRSHLEMRSMLLTRELKIGDTGNDVRYLQKFLNTLGYTIRISGTGSLGREGDYFGEATARALRAFQHDEGVEETGVLDTQTGTLLLERLNVHGDDLRSE